MQTNTKGYITQIILENHQIDSITLLIIKPHFFENNEKKTFGDALSNWTYLPYTHIYNINFKMP